MGFEWIKIFDAKDVVLMILVVLLLVGLFFPLRSANEEVERMVVEKKKAVITDYEIKQRRLIEMQVENERLMEKVVQLRMVQSDVMDRIELKLIGLETDMKKVKQGLGVGG